MSEHSDDFEKVERDPAIDKVDSITVQAEVQDYKYERATAKAWERNTARTQGKVQRAVTELGDGDFEAGMATIQQKRPSLAERIRIVLGLASVLALGAIVYENQDQIQEALASQPAEPAPVVVIV